MRIEVNHAVSVTSLYSNSFPAINREQLPSVVVRSLPEPIDALPARQKRARLPDSPSQQYLKSVGRNSQEPLSSNIIDLECFRSIFLFPLDYLRGTLIAAYQWAQKLLSVEDRQSSGVDLYV